MAVIGGPSNNTMLPVNAANVSGLVIDNLVFYYDVGRLVSYPAFGQILYDISGNGRNVTLYNAGLSTYTNGPPGAPTYNSTTEKAIHFTFDGNDFGKFTQFSTTTNRTFSAWVKLTNATTRENGLFSHCNGGPVGESYNVTSGKMKYWYYGSFPTANWYTTAGSSSVNDGTWKNLVWVKTGTAMDMYVNGSLDFTTTLSGSVNSSVACIGSAWGPCNSDSYGTGSDSYGQSFDGSIAILMLHSTALTATQVSQNFNRLRSRFGI
jgi:hypothetical protein